MCACVRAAGMAVGGRLRPKREGEASGKKRGDAIRSEPERRPLQSAEWELWEGSPFTLSLPPSLSFFRAVILNDPVFSMVPPDDDTH